MNTYNVVAILNGIEHKLASGLTAEAAEDAVARIATPWIVAVPGTVGEWPAGSSPATLN